MYKILKKLILTVIPFVLFLGMTISSFAMSKEEEKLFNMLGVEYSIDENGQFKEFLVSEKDGRITQDIIAECVKLYKDGEKIGNYTVQAGIDNESGYASLVIIDQNGKATFMATGTSTIYVNADQSFLSLNYANGSAKEADSYCLGSTILNENGRNDFEEYRRNDDGEYVATYKREGDIHYSYDENGELESYKDYESGIIYNAEGNPIKKEIKLADTYVNVPYEVADEIQAIVDKNGGNFYQKAEISEEDVKNNPYLKDAGDFYEVIPEIDEILSDVSMAEKLELDLDTYRERKEVYEKYAKEVGCTSVEAKARIYGVDREKFETNPSETSLGNEISDAISEDQIMKDFAKLINDYRVENGLQPLDFEDSLLQQVANIRAEECIYLYDCSHARPLVGSAESFKVGENTIKTYLNNDMTSAQIAQELFERWKQSPNHNTNMLWEDYTQAALGIKIVDGVIYASNNFSLYNYTEKASDIILKMVEIGPQTPENVVSAKDYYRRLFGGVNTALDNQETGTFEQSEYYIEDEVNGGHIITGSLQVLDVNGNKFQLPNGKEWDNAYFGNDTYEGTIYDRDGVEHKTFNGRIVFSCTDGDILSVYLYSDFIRVQDCPLIEVFYTNTNYPNDTIILMQHPYRTLEDIYPGGYDSAMYAMTECYVIANGNILEYSY